MKLDFKNFINNLNFLFFGTLDGEQQTTQWHYCLIFPANDSKLVIPSVIVLQLVLYTFIRGTLMVFFVLFAVQFQKLNKKRFSNFYIVAFSTDVKVVTNPSLVTAKLT